LNRVDGSAYIEWGRNKILAAVYGPRECIPKHHADPYKAVVRCRYLMAPFSSLEEHGRSGPNRRSMEISDVIREVFENVIMTENYPKTAIDIFIEVLEGHGSTRCVGVTAAAVALVTTGLPIKDIPIAVSVGKINGRLAVDMMKEEDNFGEADMAVAVRPGNKEILLLQMDGKLTRAEVEEAFDLTFKAADEIHELQVNALKDMYAKISPDSESEGNGNGGSDDEELVTGVESRKEVKDISDFGAEESEPKEIRSSEEDLKDLGE
jgi:exosome complex component RRP41